MLYFDRQMQRIQAGFNELNQQMSEKEVQVSKLIGVITHCGHTLVFQYITVDKVLKDRMAKLKIHNRIYE